MGKVTGQGAATLLADDLLNHFDTFSIHPYRHESETVMSVEIGGFLTRVKFIDRQARIRSLEVVLSVHPLQLPRHELTSLYCLCNGKDCHVQIGYTMPSTGGFNFVIHREFFRNNVPCVGVRSTLRESFEAMIETVSPMLTPFEKEPTFGIVAQ